MRIPGETVSGDFFICMAIVVWTYVVFRNIYYWVVKLDFHSVIDLPCSSVGMRVTKVVIVDNGQNFRFFVVIFFH